MSAGGLVFAYLLGALPFGYLVARLRGVDIRAVGSGNIGATNVGRTLGSHWGVLVFLLDAGKGFAAAGPLSWLVLRLGEVPASGLLSAGLGPLYAMAVFGGHVWPVFLGFRGGKGVATGAGAMVALEPVALAAGMIMWGVSLLLTRYMSVASISGGIAVFTVCVLRCLYRNGRLTDDWPLWGLTAVLLLLVIARHRSNIVRLVRGEELKLGSGDRSGGSGAEEVK
jgi:glycerol-3-phosphate acyltransferase PlsY